MDDIFLALHAYRQQKIVDVAQPVLSKLAASQLQTSVASPNLPIDGQSVARLFFSRGVKISSYQRDSSSTSLLINASQV